MLDQGGIDATSAFEDVGHSSDARTLMNRFKIGKAEKMVSRQFTSRFAIETAIIIHEKHARAIWPLSSNSCWYMLIDLCQPQDARLSSGDFMQLEQQGSSWRLQGAVIALLLAGAIGLAYTLIL